MGICKQLSILAALFFCGLSAAIVSSAIAQAQSTRQQAHHADAASHSHGDGIRIEHNLTGEIPTFQVHKNAQVQLVLSTPKPAELHLHGYDLFAATGERVPAIFTFQAIHSGRFAIVSHASDDLFGREKALAYIEITPQ